VTAAAPPLPSPPAPVFWQRARRWAPVRIVCYLAALILVLVLFGRAAQALIPPPPSTLHALLLPAKNLAMAAALLVVYALLVRILEHRHAREIGLRRGGRQFAAGLALGVGLMSLVYLVLWSLGAARFGGGTGWGGLEVGLVSALTAAVLEELLLRAVLFRILEEVGGTSAAVLLSALVFGALHGANPDATPFSMVAIAIEAGTLLALAFALTRNLWLAIGIHAGWNFAEGNLFGAPVSGTPEMHSVLATVLTGPDLVTGGGFGPEASVVSIAVCLAAALVFSRLIRRQGHWRRAHFRLRLR